jgi:hypothetical protein
MPKTKLVTAPIKSSKPMSLPAILSKSFTKVPLRPVNESDPTIRPHPGQHHHQFDQQLADAVHQIYRAAYIEPMLGRELIKHE